MIVPKQQSKKKKIIMSDVDSHQGKAPRQEAVAVVPDSPASAAPPASPKKPKAKKKPRLCTDCEANLDVSEAANDRIPGGCGGCLGLRRNMTVKKITGDFAERVGGDGFADIKRAPSWAGKVFWILLFCLAWAMVIYQTIVYITRYLSYPVSTTVELKFDEAALFPAVSFCNLNPVRSSMVATFSDDVEGLLAQSRGPPPTMAGGAPGPTDSSTHYMSIHSWDDEYSMDANSSGYHSFDEYDGEVFNPDAVPTDVQSANAFYAEYFELSDTEKKDIGHAIEDMMVECVWKERQCYPTNFTHFLHPLYGNCFSFNAGFSSPDMGQTSMETTSMPGPRDGLSVTLHVQEEEYVPLLADSVGVRVQVHSQGSNPTPEDTGYTLSAGFATALEVRKVFITRLPLPYNKENCSADTYPHQDQVQAYWPPANYSMATCTKLCYQDALLTDCGCVDPERLFLGYSASVRACETSDAADALCVAKLDAAFRKGSKAQDCEAKCPQACRETDFETQISAATWPNQYYMEILKVHCPVLETGASRVSGLSAGGMSDSDIRESTLKFSVYYQSLNYRAITEEAAYVLVDMLADLGGAVDLWVGMSVLAMCQCVEWLLLIAAFLCCGRNHSADSSKVSHLRSPKRVPSHGTLYGGRMTAESQLDDSQTSSVSPFQ